ncbi:MAG: arginine--tRNA ligase [Chloroflexi bacterium]|nr:arginine--tRNA ligase [Chloroflexota bacterium]
MKIKSQLADLVKQAALNAQNAGALPAFAVSDAFIERPQKKEWGDYATSLPLKLAREAKRAPLQIAQTLAAHFPRDDAVAKVEAAPPGFVNIYLSDAWIAAQVDVIVAQSARFGTLEPARREKIQVEHVSINPTGPMHVGSGRNGAIGDTLANILQAAGHEVQREFYINDNGTQVRHFGESLYVRYAQSLGRDEEFPEDGYQGAYAVELGKAYAEQYGEKYLQMPREQAARALGRIGIERVVAELRATLERMNVRFDNWFSERSLFESGLFAQVFDALKSKGLLYEKEDATWFAATELGLEKDAVIIRSPSIIAEPDERPTYLAGDVAYVWNKVAVRGFDRAIYVWGADHHGDMPRVYAVARALGLDAERIKILIYQFVNLKSGGELVKMSKRTGEFVTLDELLDEVGADAVRFMLISQSINSTIDFDLEVAKAQSDLNPVYYVQYAHARIASILRHAAEVGIASDAGDVALLRHPAELELIRAILRYPEIIEIAATKLEPHHLPHYAIELAGIFHAFYKQCRVVSTEPADAAISRARLKLAGAAKQTLANALALMGVRAPDAM